MLNSIRVNLLLISLFLISASINAATYYVDQGHPSASDNNAGTEAAPFLTIQKAAYVLQAGDKVFVKQGIYNEVHAIGPQSGKPGLKPQNSGTAGNPIIYEAFPGHSVVVDQQRQGNGFFISAKHYITIRGFEIRNVYGRGGVHTQNGSSNITVENCHIHSIDWDAGSNVGGIRFDEVVKPVARNNIIHNIRVAGVLNGNGSGIASYGMEDALIENNEIYDAYNGVYHKLSTGRIGALVKKNIVHDVIRGFYYDVQGGGSPGHVNQRVTQNIVSIEPFGSMFYLLVLIMPYIMLTAAFTLIYIFLPNTKVQIVPALLGALFAAVLWQAAGYFFAEFVAKSSNYDAIYSGFAALIVFLLWAFLGHHE